MLGLRTRYSLAQFLELFETKFVDVLVAKYDIQMFAGDSCDIRVMSDCFSCEKDENLLSLVGEIACTGRDLRARVTPKYRYDERFNDLCCCLRLDGYLLCDNSFIQIDPSIGDAKPVDDDLLLELKSSDLFEVDKITEKIKDSSDLFRSSSPNYNACLNDVRVALETLARSVAIAQIPDSFSVSEHRKWGAVITSLKVSGFISDNEERGLAGVYGFVSPGSHRPVGISEEDMARLGRSLALGMCWFLIKRYNNRVER